MIINLPTYINIFILKSVIIVIIKGVRLVRVAQLPSGQVAESGIGWVSVI